MPLPLSYSWRNLLARRTSTAVTLAGVAVSVMVFVVITATADGISRVATRTGDPSNLIVLSEGANSAEASRLPRDVVDVVRFYPGVARDANGDPLASEELVVVRNVPRKGARPDDLANSRYTTIRGVSPMAWKVHRRVRLIEGRPPRGPGEVVMGRLLPTKLGDVRVGDTLRFGGRDHRVVGMLAAGGEVFEGEIWADLEDLRSAVQQREASLLVVRAALPAAVPWMLEALENSKRVTVDVKPERDYYAEIGRASLAFVYLGNLIGFFMGLGAMVAGMNTLYAAMSRRVREMGTLRALGFGRWNVGGALLLESVLVALLGGGVGVGLALGFDGFALNLLGLSFELDVTSQTLLRGGLLALGIGVLGGLLPARTAARLEIVEALRHA
jgi:ABC-type lipoprotein release transport system permease subunit